MNPLMPQTGLDVWVSRVRNELASATGMAEFTDRVQQRGFDWMTSFVDSVLRDEHIVEIAKTPGRQKSAKKTRSKTAAIAASAAKIRAINREATLFEDKENAVVSPTKNSAHKMQRALLAARETGDSDEEGLLPPINAPLKSLAFHMPADTGVVRHSPARQASPTRPPKSLLRSPTKQKTTETLEPASVPSRAQLASPPPLKASRLPTPKGRSASPVVNLSKSNKHGSEPNPFVVEAPSRAPFTVLEERPLDNTDIRPRTPTAGNAAESQTHSPRSQIYSPPSSPMKIDEPAQYEREASPAQRPHSPDLAEDPIEIDEEMGGDENAPPQERPITPMSPEPLPSKKYSNPPRLSHPRVEKHHLSDDQPHELQAEDEAQHSPVTFPVAPAEDKQASPKDVTQAGASAATIHYDVVMPLNDGAGTSNRQSLYKRSSQNRQSGGAGLRRSTFARSFAPRSRVTATAGAGENEDTGEPPLPLATSSSAPSLKRKSSAVDELESVEQPRKLPKVEAATTQSAQRDLGVTAQASPPITSMATNLPTTQIESDQPAVSPLAALKALTENFALAAPPGTTEARESSHSTRSRLSLYANTKTFNIGELMGDGDQSHSHGGRSPSRSSSPEGSDEGDFSTSMEVTHHGDESGDLDDYSDVDLSGTSTEDMAGVIRAQSGTTPSNSPPKAHRTIYSVPGASEESFVPPQASEKPISTRRIPSPAPALQPSSILSPRNSGAATSSISLISVAKAMTNFFRSSPAPTQPPPTAISPPVQASSSASSFKAHVPGYNPFLQDAAPAPPRKSSGSARRTLSKNPFTASPDTKPLPAPPRSQQSQSTQTESQSTTYSSQWTASSLFDSQPPSRGTSYGGTYDTEVESQFEQDASGKSRNVFPAMDVDADDEEVAAALANASPDASMRAVRLPEEFDYEAEKTKASPAEATPAAPHNASAGMVRQISISNPLVPSKTLLATVGGSKTLKHISSSSSLTTKQQNALRNPFAPSEPKVSTSSSSSKNASSQDDVEGKKRELGEAPTAIKTAKPKLDFKPTTQPPQSAQAQPALKHSSSFSKPAPPKQAPIRPPFKSAFKPASTLAASSSSRPVNNALPTKSSSVLASSSSSRPPNQPHVNPKAEIQAKMQAALEIQIAKEKAAIKAQKSMQKLPPPPAPEPEPEQELPDIASEYSDSDDEDRPKKTLAGWAEPDEVERQLRYQEDEIDPDELFGEVGDPDLEVMFGPRNKFRVRSSSANWHNGDGVTKAEIEDYGRRMGFRKD